MVMDWAFARTPARIRSMGLVRIGVHLAIWERLLRAAPKGVCVISRGILLKKKMKLLQGKSGVTALPHGSDHRTHISEIDQYVG